ncbi:sigma-70 family RNA polymerase sigma factor [Hymenobacter ginsengisoli]|uniref:Sigma-70 family RNA polymerase sigma factor n=1 Tax=Hymenobacter ginsengisoli TaxID=1051626 RepID=A0ABP8PUC3_9BACT
MLTITPPHPVFLAGEDREAALIAQLIARDERALRMLYDRYANNLLTVILRVVHDKALAQDILQESLLKVWLSIASYDASRGRLFTWMMRVCCNQAIDAMRSPRHRFNSATQSLDVTEVQRTPAATSFNPEHIGLRELLLHLKPRQREVINLLYFGGCTQVEAAEQLGIPLATVKTRARAALLVLSRFSN